MSAIWYTIPFNMSEMFHRLKNLSKDYRSKGKWGKNRGEKRRKRRESKEEGWRGQGKGVGGGGEGEGKHECRLILPSTKLARHFKFMIPINKFSLGISYLLWPTQRARLKWSTCYLRQTFSQTIFNVQGQKHYSFLLNYAQFINLKLNCKHYYTN